MGPAQGTNTVPIASAHFRCRTDLGEVTSVKNTAFNTVRCSTGFMSNLFCA